MKLSLLALAFVIGSAYTFSVEQDVADFAANADDTSALDDVNEEARYDGRTGGPTSLPYGAVCDKNKDSCQCYGKWHGCDCPWFGSNPCTCEKRYKGTCIEKLGCPNKAEWGLDWRSEEERSPC